MKYASYITGSMQIVTVHEGDLCMITRTGQYGKAKRAVISIDGREYPISMRLVAQEIKTFGEGPSKIQFLKELGRGSLSRGAVILLDAIYMQSDSSLSAHDTQDITMRLIDRAKVMEEGNTEKADHNFKKLLAEAAKVSIEKATLDQPT